MKISFVIPAYNEEYCLPKCLESIEKELAREKCEAEVIVVNNASYDRTKEVAGFFKGVKIVDENRKGLVWARRAGYLESTGDLIANVDADSILPEGWLKKVMTEFKSDPELLALSGPLVYYDLPWLPKFVTHSFYMIGVPFNKLGAWITGSSSMLQGGNFVLRRDVIEKIGGFDTSIEFYGEDTDIGRRVGKIGRNKWTFKLPMYSSGRRIAGEGIFTMALKYGLNYLFTTFTGRPFTTAYKDFRKKLDGVLK